MNAPIVDHPGGVVGVHIPSSALQPHNATKLQVLVFEDSPNGVESAKAAGMKCVMVPDKRTDPEKCVKADSILKSLTDLNLQEWGFPQLET